VLAKCAKIWLAVEIVIESSNTVGANMTWNTSNTKDSIEIIGCLLYILALLESDSNVDKHQHRQKHCHKRILVEYEIAATTFGGFFPDRATIHS
jgi:hypothetical protein